MLALNAKFFFVTDGMVFRGYQYKLMSFVQMEEIPKYDVLIKECVDIYQAI